MTIAAPELVPEVFSVLLQKGSQGFVGTGALQRRAGLPVGPHAGFTGTGGTSSAAGADSTLERAIDGGAHAARGSGGAVGGADCQAI